MSQQEELQRIIDGRLLEAVFQPIVDASKGKICAYEGLIRGPWNSPLHSPLALFGIAGAHGLLLSLDQLARETVIRRFAELQLPGRLFINVTPSTLMDPAFRSGRTLHYLQEYGLQPQDVVIEITEHEPLDDITVLADAVRHYRDMGFQVAMDDLGGGSSTLRLWSELKPDFVKLDKHFIQGIDQDSNKRQFVASLNDLGSRLGCRIIAEGVETEQELEVLVNLDIPLLQGYLLGRPKGHPEHEIKWEQFKGMRNGHARRISIPVRSLIKPAQVVGPDMRADKVSQIMLDNSDLEYLPVVDNGHVRGMVWRQNFINLFASRYGPELNGRKPIGQLMDKHPMVVDADMPIEKLSRLITDTWVGQRGDAFIITSEERYLGVGQFLDLLREITNLQLRNARYANPLTLLPGNVPIDETSQRMLADEVDFVTCYIDIDNFKSYNDNYSYKQGDEIIRLVARLLREYTDEEMDFIGHIGGDDFIILFESKDWEQRCHQLLAAFERQIPSYYSKSDRARNGIEAPDRQGSLRFYPFMSLSIGAVPAPRGRFVTPHEIAGVAGQVKKMAKSIQGNSLFIDRRQGAATQETAAPTYASAL